MAVGSGEWVAFPNPPRPLIPSSPSCSSTSSASSPSSPSSSTNGRRRGAGGGGPRSSPLAATTPTRRISQMVWWITLLLMWLGNLHQAHCQKCIILANRKPPPPKYVYDKILQKQLALTLDTSQRTSHRISTAVLKILLEEGLGYRNVSIKNYVEDTFNTEQALSRLKAPSGKWNASAVNVPKAMINVEVWLPPSSMGENITARIDCGSHASGSRFGWYVSNSSYSKPRELITDHWRSFKRLAVTEIFALTPDEQHELKERYTKDERGRYYCDSPYCEEGIFTSHLCEEESNCAILFVGDHNAYSEFLVEQVVKEELYVRIAWIGPNLTPEFFCRVRNSKPSVFFDWYPDSLTNMDEFMPVSFPPCNSNKEIGDSYLCNYELHSMKKLIWDKLPESARVAVEAVKRFHLREEDYRDLLSRYNERTTHCESSNSSLALVDTDKVIEGIACDWLREAKRHGVEVWNDWISHNYAAKTKLWIAGIFPMSLGVVTTFSSGTLYRAAQMAIERVNKNDSILQDYKIDLMIQDGKCKSEEVLASFISYVRKGSGDPNSPFEQMIGVLGPACSDTVEPLAGVASHFETVVLSYSAEGAIFNEHEKYPSFFRTIPENKMYGSVYLELFKLFEWHQVASLAEDCNKYSEYLTLLDNMLPKDINLENFRFPKVSTRNMTDHLLKLKDKTYRIIIGDFYASTAREVLCEAYLQNMTAKYNYVWFLPRWFAANWYMIEPDEHIPCNKSMMLEAVDRHMSLGYAYYAADNSTFHEGITVAEWREDYINDYGQGKDNPADYAGYTYDAVWTYAFALNKLLKEDRTHVANLHSEKTNKRFVELIRETDFEGVSGNIKFKSGPSRESVINIMQFIVNDEGTGGSYVTVGQFFPTGNGSNSGKLSLVKTETRFFYGIPIDGIIPDTCLFQTFSDLLDVSCDMAIVIVMVTVFAVFAIVVLALFIVYKRKYEKMIPDQPVWPLGELMSLDEWELPREKVVINRTIGEGAFGTVYGGECQFGDNTPWLAVAVKTLKVGSTIEEKLDFLGEAEMMKRFNHKNVVQLLGLCTHQEPIYMVMEFMLYGDLKIYLLARRHLVSDKTVQTEEDEVSSKRLTSMALDVSRALAYLAEHRYVHRDVACRNCLVSAERIVKLSDFGMTRPMYESEYYRFNRRAMMPVRWMSPESLEDGIFTSMSDMWSFGVLLYEIITFGSFPFQVSGMTNNQVLEHVKAGNTITIPFGVKPQLERLLRSCWAKSPLDRPTFNDMIDHLTMWPRLITPVLEVPSAAVQMNDTDSLELVMVPTEQTTRRSSAPNTRIPDARIRNPSGNDLLPNCNAVQMNNLSHQTTSLLNNTIGSTPNSLNPSISFSSPSWSRALQENGEGPSVEPLLPQNGDGYVSSYVRLQNPKTGEESVNSFDFPSNMTAV